MALTLSDYYTQIDYRRRDTTNTFISEAEKLYYLNEGLRKVNGFYDWEFNRREVTVGVSSGTTSYALSAYAIDFKLPVAMQYDTANQFSYVNPEQFNNLSAYAYFNMYSIDGSNLLIQTAFGSGNVTFSYYSHYMARTSAGSLIPALSSYTDYTVIYDRYQDSIVDYAVAQIMKKERKFEDYQLYFGDWQNDLRNMRRDYPSRAKHAWVRMKNGSDNVLAINALLDPKMNPLQN